MSKEEEESLREELDAVEAILMDGVEAEVNQQVRKVRIRLDPLTASEEDKKYVSLSLEMDFPRGYPDKEPNIQIRNPRGLLEASVSVLLATLRARAGEFASSGTPVIFELVEQAREFLTESNVPACNCAICLNDIVDGDHFRKTPCEHYFHTNCLGRYAESAVRAHREFLEENPSIPGTADAEERRFRLTCPVCRAEVPGHSDQHEWLRAPVAKLEEEQEAFQVTDELRELQKRMSRLYLRQQAKGSIIDMEEEGKKFLVLTQAGQESSNDGGDVATTRPSQIASQIPFTQEAGSSGFMGLSDPPEEVEKRKEEREEEEDKGRRRGHRGGGGRGHYSHRQNHYYQRQRRSHHTYIKEMSVQQEQGRQESPGGQACRPVEVEEGLRKDKGKRGRGRGGRSGKGQGRGGGRGGGAAAAAAGAGAGATAAGSRENGSKARDNSS